jgi:hypothetical protein
MNSYMNTNSLCLHGEVVTEWCGECWVAGICGAEAKVAARDASKPITEFVGHDDEGMAVYRTSTI